MKYAMMMAAALLFLAPSAARANDCGHWEFRGPRRIWIPARVVVVERPRRVVVVVPCRERVVRVVRPVRFCR
jgi:hypothetical protein